MQRIKLSITTSRNSTDRYYPTPPNIRRAVVVECETRHVGSREWAREKYRTHRFIRRSRGSLSPLLLQRNTGDGKPFHEGNETQEMLFGEYRPAGEKRLTLVSSCGHKRKSPLEGAGMGEILEMRLLYYQESPTKFTRSLLGVFAGARY